MTGILKVQCVSDAQGELATDFSEAVCLCFRKIPSKGGVLDGATGIEGYLQWCERDVRSCVTGTMTSGGTVHLSISGDSVIVGAPENLEWMRNLKFEGSLVDGRLKGEFSLSTVVDKVPSLAPGNSQVHQLSLPPQIRQFLSVRSTFKAHLLVKENTPEGQYIATVEVSTYTYSKMLLFHKF